VRHRAFIGGNISLPHGFSVSPFAIINSGQPYNLTTGQDSNGDSLFNDRPWFATSQAIAVCTARTDFSTSNLGLGAVPVNYCTGPANTSLNLRLSKTFGFGRETGAGRHQDGPRFGSHGGGPRGGSLGPGGLSGSSGHVMFGPGASVSRRFNLTFSISARNLLNTFNPGNPVGNLSSPLFGQAISVGGGPFASSSANRRVDLQIRFSF
jgi:hypothetical protein